MTAYCTCDNREQHPVSECIAADPGIDFCVICGHSLGACTCGYDCVCGCTWGAHTSGGACEDCDCTEFRGEAGQ